jgi:prepilin-type N-terminal cleavage/methylation domain-containing protein/prepilin-type processing-associated H-X9-DG protein
MQAFTRGQADYRRRVTARASRPRRPRCPAFTLIELLVVISIISLLISILLPSMSRARDQAKSVHCLARLREFGTAMAAYENTSGGVLPPARWYPSERDLDPDETNDRRDISDTDPAGAAVEYGWIEILFTYVYRERVSLTADYPVQRNIEGQRWQKYFICEAVGHTDVNGGHYRVYLPAWSAGSYALGEDGVYGETTRADPDRSCRRERIYPKLPLIGDANERSERGDGLGDDDCSYIDAGEANYVGSNGINNGNRFSDRHYGGTNYLFQDLHAAWKPKLRQELARDYDLNGVIDITDEQP